MPCKPITICSSLLPHPKKKKKHPRPPDFLDLVVPPSPRLHRHCLPHGLSPPPLPDHRKCDDKACRALRRSSSEAHREFLRATASCSGASESAETNKIVSPRSLPPCDIAYAQFNAAYPRFSETRVLDQLRVQQYRHLEEDESVCLDYCGFGLFCDEQREEELELIEEESAMATTNATTTMFLLTEVSANLWSHALFGSAPEGTMEWGIRSRIMEFLSIPESEYSLVFTVSRGASFKLLADAYPWRSSPRLVTMYDYESESVGWMEQRAAEKGAKVFRARFRWPSLRVCSAELKRELLISAASGGGGGGGDGGGKKSRRSAKAWLDRLQNHQREKKAGSRSSSMKKKGLFVFPVQSRVSGAKYSYQWMSMAQQNQWHVMLDASALGPKDMDSLALSLFRPDFITASFYKLFGGDPSGFGCLLIKNSVAQSIQDPSGALVSGMVRISPLSSSLSAAASSTSMDTESLDADTMVSSFSGPVPSSFQDLDMPPLHPLPACLELSGREEEEEEEEEDIYSSACDEADGVSRSSVFSENGAGENPFFLRHVSASESISASNNPSVFSSSSAAAAASSSISHIHGRRDSRIRIKDLCSGLLHLHTRRVGDNNGEEQDVSMKDGGGKVFPEEEDEEMEEVWKQQMDTHQKLEDAILAGKHAAMADLAGKHATMAADLAGKHATMADLSLSDIQSIKYELGACKEEEKLLLLLKKVEQQQQQQHTVSSDDDPLPPASLHQHNKESADQEIKPELASLQSIAEIETEIQEAFPHKDHVPPPIIPDQPFPNLRENSILLLQEKPSTILSSSRKSNAICRETDGGFRLLGRRNSDRFSLSKILSSVPGNESSRSRSAYLGGVHGDLSFGRSSEMKIVDDDEEDQVVVEVIEEPQLLCKSLDHADMLGLNRTSFRLRYLINWLISSLLRLKHPGNDMSLVRIYGPQVKYDRGASVAFNIFDSQGKLLHPEHVRMLADQLNIYLGLGFLRNVYFRGNPVEMPIPGYSNTQASQPSSNKIMNLPSRVEVVTAALGLLSDFKDVYRLWAFVAMFLDPNYVALELNHLHPSNRDSSEEKNSEMEEEVDHLHPSNRESLEEQNSTEDAAVPNEVFLVQPVAP